MGFLIIQKRTYWGCCLSYGRRGHSPKISSFGPFGSHNQGYPSGQEKLMMGFIHPLFYVLLYATMIE
jgi:hypothetical protein